MSRGEYGEVASSDIMSILLMLTIVIIITALVLSALLGMLGFYYGESVSCVFQIISIQDSDGHGTSNDGIVTLRNIGGRNYDNRNLSGRTYVNDRLIDAGIESLNFNEWIFTTRHGIQYIGGPGTNGHLPQTPPVWYSGQDITINYANGLIHPGDKVTIEIYDRYTGAIISRDTFPHSERQKTTEWWINEFTHPST